MDAIGGGPARAESRRARPKRPARTSLSIFGFTPRLPPSLRNKLARKTALHTSEASPKLLFGGSTSLEYQPSTGCPANQRVAWVKPARLADRRRNHYAPVEADTHPVHLFRAKRHKLTTLVLTCQSGRRLRAKGRFGSTQRYRPHQRGLRFSRNAPIPSLASTAIALRLITSFV